MSLATTKRPAPGTSSLILQMPLLRFWGTTVGLKLITAFTGVGLTGFVLIHMLGNLQVFQGAEALDEYGHLLHKEPAVLWGARVALLTMVGLHIASIVILTRRTLRAQSATGGYPRKHRESSFASRTMRWTGGLLLAFIVYHILHLTTGSVHPDYHEGSVYANLVSGLRVLPVAIIYVASMGLLALHLWHGVWSLFQTLGFDPGRYGSFGRRFATGFTIVVVAGFMAVPIAVATGVVKPVPVKQSEENGRQFDKAGIGHDVPSPAAASEGKAPAAPAEGLDSPKR